MTHEYNPFWQQRIRETVLHALDVHPRLTALRVDLRLPDVPAATDAAVIPRFINALKARIDAYQKRKRREGKRVHPTTCITPGPGNSGCSGVKNTITCCCWLTGIPGVVLAITAIRGHWPG